ncbi:AI-2E family transporter [Siphonobacter curvatus]|uniref:AI-2E family transporter n=1 Tax=Siphonobacter curvatus TaxID=2094562 RepID=A0A2S7IKJ8_9BACT|nr:AI-2E family transporter [Siphonobacter curvatus]PQA58159.1 AI-2E family transporter [Siphonobacter curvatus]
MTPEPTLPYPVRLAAILICVLLIIYGLYALQGVVTLLLFSLLLAMLLFPLCRKLERWKFPRVAAIFVCLVILIGVLVGIGWVVSMQMANFSDDFPKFQNKMNAVLDRAQEMANDQLGLDKTRQNTEIRRITNDVLHNSGSYITTFLSSTTSTLADLSLIPLFVFFILLYRDFFRSFVYKLFSKTKRSRLDDVLSKIYVVVQGYLAGLVLVIGIVACLNTTGLLILGIDYAWFFGTLAAVLLLVPYIGILIGSLLPTIYALVTKDSPMYAVGVIGVFSFVQILEGNFITPYVVGSKVSVNPLAAMVVLILGGQLWGISGLVLALPVTAIVKVICDNVDGLKPYGFLLGDPEYSRGAVVKSSSKLPKLDTLTKRKRKVEEALANEEQPQNQTEARSLRDQNS